jgi:hypothetical protein
MNFSDNDKFYFRIFKRKRKKFQKMESILKEWYGEEKGATELSHYLPKEEKIQDILDSIISKNLGPKEQKLMDLKKSWSDIMGKQIEKISTPVSIKNNFLTIEVENSAWLMELKNFHGKLIEKKIKEFCGEHFFYRIIYTLKGKRKSR